MGSEGTASLRAVGGGLARKRQRVVRQPTRSLRHPRRLQLWPRESRSRNQGTAPGPARQPRDPHSQVNPAPGTRSCPKPGCCETPPRTLDSVPGRAATIPQPQPHNSDTAPSPAATRPAPTGNPGNPDTAVSPAAARPPPVGMIVPYPRPGTALPATSRQAGSPPAASERLLGRVGSRPGRRTAL